MRAELLEDERRDAVRRAVRGVDDDAHAVEREVARERLLEEDDVAAARVFELLGAPDPGARGALAEERVVRASGARSRLSASSGSLKPSPPKILMPLSWYGLWLALMTMPASARMLTVRCAMAGVGIGPQSITRPPIAQTPLAMACSSM